MELFGLFIGACAVGLGMYLDKRRKTVKLPEGSALAEPIKFDELARDPDKLAELAEKISSIGLIHQNITARSRREEDYTLYEAFAVDSNGIPNTFLRGKDHEEVVTKAQWLADQLDVPLNDRTY